MPAITAGFLRQVRDNVASQRGIEDGPEKSWQITGALSVVDQLIAHIGLPETPPMKDDILGIRQ